MKSASGSAIPTSATEINLFEAYQKEGKQSMPTLNEQQGAAIIAHIADLVMELQDARREAAMYREWYNEKRLALDALTAKKEDANEF